MQKSNRRKFAHTKELSGDGRASEQLTLAEIRELTTLAQRLECSPMAKETWVQSQVESYQRL